MDSKTVYDLILLYIYVCFAQHPIERMDFCSVVVVGKSVPLFLGWGESSAFYDCASVDQKLETSLIEFR
jgi:hypothetical protein